MGNNMKIPPSFNRKVPVQITFLIIVLFLKRLQVPFQAVFIRV